MSWLPSLIRLSDFRDNWDEYVDAVYAAFKSDFVDVPPVFEGKRLGLKRHPTIHGREATFWHMITSGSDERSRQPDISRCERIRWPRAIIDNHDDRDVKKWENERRGDRRILLLKEPERYLVVLTERKGYMLPWTAFVVDRNHRYEKLMREFAAYKKAGTYRQD